MSTWLRKGMLGYSDIADRYDDKGDATHIRLSVEEYDKLKSEITQLKYKVDRTNNDCDIKLQDMNKKALAYGKKKDEEASQKVREVEAELVEALEERNYQMQLNENLLRINKERSNAERRLQPKKKHTGYVVIQSQEKTIKYAVRKGYVAVNAWETIIQSPFSVDFAESIARREIETELSSNISEELGMSMYLVEDCAEIYTDEQCEGFNMLFQMRLRANYKGGYWEVVIMHTRPLKDVPKELRA